MNREYLENAVKGAIIGHLIGDALGTPYENSKNIDNFKIEMISVLSDQKMGSWSMPGAFCLATIDSLLEYENINIEDLSEQLINVYLGGHLTQDSECRDVSKLTARSLQNAIDSIPLEKCGEREEVNNDCLLRMLPISLFLANQETETLVLASHEVCNLTNNHPLAQTSCALYSLLIKNILLNNKEKTFALLKDFYKHSKMEEHVKYIEEIEKKKSDPFTGSKDIVDCFWSSWHSFTKTQNNYEASLVSSIKLGNDTNGTACITGSFSGLYNSVNEIPRRWLYQIELPSEIMVNIQKFVDFIINRIQN